MLNTSADYTNFRGVQKPVEQSKHANRSRKFSSAREKNMKLHLEMKLRKGEQIFTAGKKFLKW